MAAPNIASLTTITGKTAVLAVTGSASNILNNAAASGMAYKVNSLYVTNVGAATKYLTVDLYRSSTAYHIAYRINVPTGSVLMPILKDGPIYLEEGDAIRLTAETTAFLEAVCSYEELS